MPNETLLNRRGLFMKLGILFNGAAAATLAVKGEFTSVGYAIYQAVAGTDQIADATKVPKAYLAKVLHKLAGKGIVQTQRGVGGGVALARTPEHLTILDVVNAVEPIERIRTCPLKLKTHGVRLCPLHKRVDAALGMVDIRVHCKPSALRFIQERKQVARRKRGHEHLFRIDSVLTRVRQLHHVRR